MQSTVLSPDEVIRQGEEIYQRELRSRVETPDNIGKFLSLDIFSGEYEIDEDDLTAEERLLSRKPEARIYVIRIGYPAAYHMGWRASLMLSRPKYGG